MDIKITQHNGINIAEVISEKIIIREVQDAIDLMADCNYQGCGRIIIRESNLTKDFFDLKTGIAGDILQKFSNYKVRLAIAGDFLKFPGKSLKDFIFESNKHGRIIFVDTIQEAYEKFSV
jgi:hypothetical protein